MTTPPGDMSGQSSGKQDLTTSYISVSIRSNAIFSGLFCTKVSQTSPWMGKMTIPESKNGSTSILKSSKEAYATELDLRFVVHGNSAAGETILDWRAWGALKGIKCPYFSTNVQREREHLISPC